MEKMWMRTILTLAIGLSLSACGKSKDDSSGGGAPAPVAKTDAKKASTGDKDLKIPGGKDGSGALPEGAHIKGEQKGQEQGQQGNQGQQPGNQGQQGGKSGQNNGSTKSSAEISQDEVADMLAEAGRYSGSAPDGLREILMDQQDSIKDEQQRAKNLKLANAIKKASFRFDYIIGKYKIDIEMLQNSLVVGLVGDIRTQASGMATNQKNYHAKVACMDQSAGQSQGCETVVVHLNYQNANAKIILRKTDVQIQGSFPARNCLTKACEDIYGLLRNTELKIKEANTIRYSVMDSFEVIQGPSGFRLFVVTNENEVIKIAGPLANPVQYPVLDTPTDRNLTKEELRDSRTGEIFKTVMHNSLHDVNIMTNDGYGNVNLLVKMPVLRGGDRDHFQLYLQRKIQPIQIIQNW